MYVHVQYKYQKITQYYIAGDIFTDVLPTTIFQLRIKSLTNRSMQFYIRFYYFIGQQVKSYLLFCHTLLLLSAVLTLSVLPYPLYKLHKYTYILMLMLDGAHIQYTTWIYYAGNGIVGIVFRYILYRNILYL